MPLNRHFHIEKVILYLVKVEPDSRIGECTGLVQRSGFNLQTGIILPTLVFCAVDDIQLLLSCQVDKIDRKAGNPDH